MNMTSSEQGTAAMSTVPIDEVPGILTPLVQNHRAMALEIQASERPVSTGSCTGAVDRLKEVQSKIAGCLGGKLTLSVKSDLEAKISAALGVNAATDGTSVVENFNSSYSGLTVGDANERLSEDGPNVLSYKSASPWWKILWDAFWHPFNMILIVLAVISGATQDISTLTIMLVMVIISVGLRFQQVIGATD
jgi:magnesium-transporting ATPase (P-type)